MSFEKDIQKRIYELVGEKNEIFDIQKYGKWTVEEIAGAVRSLATRKIIDFDEIKSEVWWLTEEGKNVATGGSYEWRVVSSLLEHDGKMTREELSAVLPRDVVQYGVGYATRLRWISIANGVLSLQNMPQEDSLRTKLESVIGHENAEHAEKSLVDDLKKRKYIEKRKVLTYNVRVGPNYAYGLTKEETDLTIEQVLNGEWENIKYKNYNMQALGKQIVAGHLHPLMKVREEFKNIFLEMGFEEMETSRFVESSFWNFDALFQPQNHPARDAQDTFFLKKPAQTLMLPTEYVKEVEKIHSHGGFGSLGYNYEWKYDEAQKNILRTHTTAVSSRMLYQLAKNNEIPKKYFSIDRVFRNETLDATHLAEFHQIEGLVADRGLGINHLIGILDVFFKKMGLGDLKYKPAYNPYTEPSLEVFCYHKALKKWIEVGNSGVFRPEMLRAMGFPEDISVVAWGLSLERPTMIRYAISNIRDLMGHKVNLEMVEESPICRLGHE